MLKNKKKLKYIKQIQMKIIYIKLKKNFLYRIEGKKFIK